MNYIIYHANCMDGLCSAWVALNGLRQLGFNDSEIVNIPAHYNKPLPELELQPTDAVYIVDFSYPRDVTIALAKRCQLTVLDHHETARTALHEISNEAPGVFVFDMEQSGAGVTWNWFFPNIPMPSFVQMIQDRDLWRFNLPDSKALATVLQNHPRRHDMAFWDEMLGPIDWTQGQLHQTKLLDELLEKGRILLEPLEGQLKSFIDHKHYKIIQWHGYRVALFNTTVLMSELGEVAYEKIDVDFSMSYFINQDGRVVFSLRTHKNGPVHVGAFAVEYGGGGHQAAAGFSCDGIKGFKFLSDLYLS